MIGIDALSGCKGESHLVVSILYFTVPKYWHVLGCTFSFMHAGNVACMKKHLIPNMCADPEKQFLLLLEHIHMIRSKVQWIKSHITIYVEHNLGFEVSVGHSYGFEVMGVGHSRAPGVVSIVRNEPPGIQEDVCTEWAYLGD